MEFLSGNEEKKQKHPILFLHGAYCDSWVWKEHYLKYFSDKGFDCYTLDFESEDFILTFQPTTLNTYVDQVMDVISQMDSKPIIVAHSMGAAVIQKLYQKYKLDFPAWVLMTPAPPRNFYVSSQEMLLKNPMLFSQMYILQMLGKHFVSPDLAKYALFADDFDDKLAQSYLPNIKGMPNSVVADIMTLTLLDEDLKVNFPVFLQAATQDKLISSDNLSTVENTYNVKAKYYESGHAVMLDKSWQESADDIISFIETKIK